MSLLKLIRDRSQVEGGCWIWTQGVNEHGSPCTRYAGRWSPVRRYLALEFGPQPKGRTLVPICGDKLCVRPEHQKSVTLSEMQKMVAASGGHSRPDKRAKVAATQRAKSRLDMDAVNAIRNSNTTLTVEAQKWGVSPSTISCIRRGKRWAAIGGIF